MPLGGAFTWLAIFRLHFSSSMDYLNKYRKKPNIHSIFPQL